MTSFVYCMKHMNMEYNTKSTSSNLQFNAIFLCKNVKLSRYLLKTSTKNMKLKDNVIFKIFAYVLVSYSSVRKKYDIRWKKHQKNVHNLT